MEDNHKVIKDQTGLAIANAILGVRDAIKAGTGGTVYGFHIDSSESDPYECVTYLADAVGMTPAKMNFNTGVFDYGSWEDAFFMPRPCMLKYDGTVDYYLSPSDYTKKVDGVTPSDVADDSYGGNAMMEWGRNGKKIWYKIVPDSDPTSAKVYIADYRVDDDYHAWSFINHEGNMVEHFYTPIYNGTIDSAGRLRSISGKGYADLCKNKTAPQEIAAAELNNPTGKKLWYTEVYADITLINLLLILVRKSLQTQGVFGNGRISQASATENMLGTGTMDAKGLFWGSNGNNYGVKVFGMENYWANQWRRFAGLIYVDYVEKYKLTRGTQDGSTAADYNTTGDGYITGNTAPSDSGKYISKFSFDKNQMGIVEVAGTATTFYCDYEWINSGTRYACRGGSCDGGATCGAFFLLLNYPPSGAAWDVGAAPSCKPLS